MKKIFKFSILAITVLLIISSCNKNNEQLLIDEAKISSSMAMNTKEERQVSFRLLNATEKSEVWKRHLSECANDIAFTKDQKDFILGLILSLNASQFAKSSTIEDKNGQLETWKTQALQLFQEQNDINWLFLDFTRKKPTITPVSDEIKKRILAQFSKQEQSTQIQTRKYEDCACSTSDDWCTITQVSSCWYWVTNCSAGSCTSAGWGCGWFIAASCNGKCGSGQMVYTCR